MQSNNPIIEVSLAVLSALFVLGGILLLYVGKIDATFATLMFGFPAALFGINVAIKAPSPSQQQQLANQHQDLQVLASQLVSVLPGLFAQAQPGQPVPLVPMPAAAQPVPQQPFPAKSTFEMPVVPVQL